MHLIVDELLTEEQLNSPKRYIYEICEMYGWDFPDVVDKENKYVLEYKEVSLGKARKRERLVRDACLRLKTHALSSKIVQEDTQFRVTVEIPKYNKRTV